MDIRDDCMDIRDDFLYTQKTPGFRSGFFAFYNVKTTWLNTWYRFPLHIS